jgi:hypothetical protein
MHEVPESTDGNSSSKKAYRSSFIPGLHDVCMVFETTNEARRQL